MRGCFWWVVGELIAHVIFASMASVVPHIGTLNFDIFTREPVQHRRTRF